VLALPAGSAQQPVQAGRTIACTARTLLLLLMWLLRLLLMVVVVGMCAA
jgi:hypothetical protein